MGRFDEFCANELFKFTNFYWINDDGRVGQNRQFVSHGSRFLGNCVAQIATRPD